MPVGAQTFREALRCGAEVFHNLKKLMARVTPPPWVTKAVLPRTWPATKMPSS
jgi:hypothetical protein